MNECIKLRIIIHKRNSMQRKKSDILCKLYKNQGVALVIIAIAAEFSELIKKHLTLSKSCDIIMA